MAAKLFNPLEHPVCFAFPHLIAETAWMEHAPFAMFLVSAQRPRVVVELGSFRGVSYCAFCQAVKTLRLDARCYAVDTWQGDAHAGELAADALLELRAHHDPLYSDFSRLVQSTFDEAVKHFADGSIDLLHIDGFHSYEAVRRDFETWLPKMSARGIVLFHDLNVRERDFGVWRFWAEFSPRRPRFEFLHGHGLGVLAVGAEQNEILENLFAADEAEIAVIREFFQQLGARLEAVRARQAQARTVHEQQNVIAALRQYERTVQKSRALRLVRVLREEGLSSAFRKTIGKS